MAFSFLHDLGLRNSETPLATNDLSKLSESDRQDYIGHPSRGAKILSGLEGIDPAIPQIVHQHHRRIDGSGFPKHIPVIEILKPAELIGIADEFTHEIEKKAATPSLDPYAEMEYRFSSFSDDVVDAFKKTFKRSLKK